MTRRRLRCDLSPPPAPIVLCACGSPDWIACRPGTRPLEEGDLGPNVVPIVAEPDEAAEYWCVACWPWMRKKRPRRRPVRPH